MVKITIQTMEGDQTIDLSEPRGAVIFHIEGKDDITIRPSEYGIEVRHGRLNRRLVLRPDSSSSVHVSVENDF